jgi:tRNA A-37 threonylcarbamoyl transferase component Bud32
MARSLGDGRYELGRRLGYGGMATVYLARDLKLYREVAIKVLADNYAGDDEIRSRFMREARLAAKLDHPNVVQVFDVGDDGERPYIVMEHVDGGTLDERLSSRRRALPRADALRLLGQMCQGLGHAHSKRLVHRDIKPGNLLLRNADDCLKIADFGIARAAEDTRLTQPGRVIGTERYMAPEQIADGKITPATDIYACGVVADEILPAARPPTLQEIVERCLREDPGERFPDATRLGAALAAVDGNGTAVPLRRIRTQGKMAPLATATRRLQTATRRRAGPVRSPLHRRRGARVAAALAAIALAAGGVAAVLGSGGSDSPSDAKSAAQPAAPAPEVPQSDDAATQARQLADFLRAQSRAPSR